MSQVVTAALLTTAAWGATFIPNFSDFLGPKSTPYNAIKRQGQDLSDDDATAGTIMSDHAGFWVDGTTNVSVQGEDYFLWMLATVHSPQLLPKSKLTLFGQIDNTPLPDEETEDQTAVEPAAGDDAQPQQPQQPAEPDAGDQQNTGRRLQDAVKLSTWTCTIKFELQKDNKKDWSVRDISGGTIIDTAMVGKNSLDLDSRIVPGNSAGWEIHQSVDDLNAFDANYKFWGIDKARSNTVIFKEEQFITTCAMWRKLKTGQDEGKMDLSIESPIMKVNLGYQASVSDPQNDASEIVGQAATISVAMFSGASAMATTLLASASILALTIF